MLSFRKSTQFRLAAVKKRPYDKSELKYPRKLLYTHRGWVRADLSWMNRVWCSAIPTGSLAAIISRTMHGRYPLSKGYSAGLRKMRSIDVEYEWRDRIDWRTLYFPELRDYTFVIEAKLFRCLWRIEPIATDEAFNAAFVYDKDSRVGVKEAIERAKKL